MNRVWRERMLRAAVRAVRNAYAPYSGFRVGAAVLSGSNRIFSGTNIENSSFGLTVCAERVALWKAVAAGERTIKAVLVYTDTDDLTPPCGACRQVIFEFSADAEIVMTNGRRTETCRLAELLPAGFRLKNRHQAMRSSPPR